MSIVVAISGASGSGKSTLSNELQKYLASISKTAEIVPADRYFKKNLPTMVSPADGQTYPDWNSPDSVDMDALADEVERLKSSGGLDFIIVEGVTIFLSERLRSLADVKIYVDATIEMRIFRRINRNVVEKNQTIEFIGGYYLKCARYREAEYSLPSAKYADFHVDNEWGFDVTEVANKILSTLKK